MVGSQPAQRLELLVQSKLFAPPLRESPFQLGSSVNQVVCFLDNVSRSRPRKALLTKDAIGRRLVGTSANAAIPMTATPANTVAPYRAVSVAIVMSRFPLFDCRAVARLSLS